MKAKGRACQPDPSASEPLANVLATSHHNQLGEPEQQRHKDRKPRPDTIQYLDNALCEGHELLNRVRVNSDFHPKPQTLVGLLRRSI